MRSTYLTQRGTTVELTTDDSRSSYGIPVLVIGGRAYGAADLTPEDRRDTYWLAALVPSHEATALRADWRAELGQQGTESHQVVYAESDPAWVAAHEREFFA